jgi:hypothetical protein
MKTRSLRFSIITTVLGLFLIGGVNVRAQSTVASANLLTQAYATLSVADHDYKGHRVAAMKQIAAAGKLVGVAEMGNGKGHEQQVVSDQQLKTATGLLQQALPGLPPNAQKHVNKALEQLSIALSIK